MSNRDDVNMSLRKEALSDGGCRLWLATVGMTTRQVVSEICCTVLCGRQLVTVHGVETSIENKNVSEGTWGRKGFQKRKK